MKRMLNKIENWDIFSKHFWRGVGSVFDLSGDHFNLGWEYRYSHYRKSKTYFYSSNGNAVTEEDMEMLNRDFEKLNEDFEQVGKDMDKAMRDMDEMIKEKQRNGG